MKIYVNVFKMLKGVLKMLSQTGSKFRKVTGHSSLREQARLPLSLLFLPYRQLEVSWRKAVAVSFR